MSNRENKYLLDVIVELDDTYIGTLDRGKKRGRGATKMKNMVAVSNNSDEELSCIFQPVYYPELLRTVYLI